MKIRHWLISGFILIVATAFIPPVQAEETGFYVGGGAGRSDDDILNDTDFAWKAFGGFQFSRNLAVEVAYIDLGDFKVSDGQAFQDGVAFDLVARIPGNRIDLFGKAGIFFWTYDAPTFISEGEDLTLGFGLNFKSADRRWAIRGEWERFFDIAGGDVDLLSASFIYKF